VAARRLRAIRAENATRSPEMATIQPGPALTAGQVPAHNAPGAGLRRTSMVPPQPGPEAEAKGDNLSGRCHLFGRAAVAGGPSPGQPRR